MHRYLRGFNAVFVTVLMLSSFAVRADILQLDIEGLKDEKLLENIKAHIGSNWVSSSTMSSQRRRDRFRTDAEISAAKALRPYGYYFPQIESTLGYAEDQTWVLKLLISPGPAVKVRQLELEIKGQGSQQEDIKEWRANWPLLPGVRLDQQIWEQQKQAVLDITAEQGYLSAAFDVSKIDLDLEGNTADLVLILDTGPRAVMGDIHYIQDAVGDEVLMPIPRFNKGDFYSAWLVDRLRIDLWRIGYFDEINVVEQKHLDQDPQQVDFEVTLKERKKNTHQGTIGYGTDSQFRTQYRWQRHLLSTRGDSVSVGLGWQQRNEEILLFSEYRIPRKTRSNQQWLLGGVIKSEVEELDIGVEDSDGELRLFSGRVEDFSVRAGKLKLHNISWSQEQISETLYVQFLLEDNNFRDDPVTSATISSPLPGLQLENEDVDDLIDTSRSLALGWDWDWPVIMGRRFNTSGHHERAWIITANDIWGSEQEFTQLYLSTRWNFVLSDRWKLLVRGEIGYTHADVHDFTEETGGDPLSLSVTELPFFYRFKAGGSRSVRGYAFEELSTNNIGSNHIVTASAEVEYQFIQDWSLAAFYDIGNAFNHWSDADLHAGIGVGLRWYTIAGAIRIDFAQAQDLAGKPWQFHLTIGTPLL